VTKIHQEGGPSEAARRMNAADGEKHQQEVDNTA